MADRLEAQMAAGEVGVDAVRTFASEADEVVPDAQGRIRLLPHLRDEVGLERNVIVTGALRRIEIWGPDAWADRKPEGREKLAAAIERGHGLGPSTD